MTGHEDLDTIEAAEAVAAAARSRRSLPAWSEIADLLDALVARLRDTEAERDGALSSVETAAAEVQHWTGRYEELYEAFKKRGVDKRAHHVRAMAAEREIERLNEVIRFGAADLRARAETAEAERDAEREALAGRDAEISALMVLAEESERLREALATAEAENEQLRDALAEANNPGGAG